ncbi:MULTISPECIES: hypothetical protein [unclassified Gordonia (in: high G+C Gram-positive bacteria)]|uniref:hypothetical protein n=1 Tax=unclassified Gordonia (in: high G+C Gram-positive bacteria) TaxID=2657482 RepID=UPI0007EA0990|nr:MULTISPECIES: hypothetical protein [unclassified Gordonia (in: high G+C Gram-positive bacteria)]OBB99946.1 hypothetical protein A5785_19455 [Gordonia sp. 852002-50395_SCH5434458]OBC04277.1 hypothetical protein A5786_12450 [Gordonia sp. 852002-50816_SCH5313054-a]OBC14621.1 hypothetical protein A5788_16690 [Gordonia sp. 852002-50816_SCH5313054-c]
MGIQFRLGPNDHKPVEDFLSRDHTGTAAITLDTKAVRHQKDAAAAAVEAGLSVYWEPAAERLAARGYDLEKLPLWTGRPYDIDSLSGNLAERAALVGLTIDKHPELSTHITAPHFYVTDERTARLNVDLAERTRIAVGQDKPTRAVVTLATTAITRLGIDLAAEYAGAGIGDIEIRFSPLGGDEEGIRKIRTAFGVLDQFREHGMTVTLGLSGNIGRAALAMGHADAYSVGLGMLEKVNHAQTMSRYRKAPDPEKGQGGGAAAGIYLPALGATVSSKAARQLLSHTDIRTRVGCRIGSCRNSVTGPLDDRRAHYLHARSGEVAETLRRPAPWRGAMEVDRLTEAIALRDRVNEHYLSEDVRKLGTRTLRSLIDEIEHEQQQAS